MLDADELEYDKEYFAKGRWGRLYKGKYNKNPVCVKEIKKSSTYDDSTDLVKSLVKDLSSIKKFVVLHFFLLCKMLIIISSL
jgi:hypothetical protein